MKVKVKNKNIEQFTIEDATKIDIEHDGFLYRIQVYVDGTLLINKSNGVDENLKISPRYSNEIAIK